MGGTADLVYTDTITGMNPGDQIRGYAYVETGSDGPAGFYGFDLKVDVKDDVYQPFYTSGMS